MTPLHTDIGSAPQDSLAWLAMKELIKTPLVLNFGYHHDGPQNPVNR